MDKPRILALGESLLQASYVTLYIWKGKQRRVAMAAQGTDGPLPRDSQQC